MGVSELFNLKQLQGTQKLDFFFRKNELSESFVTIS